MFCNTHGILLTLYIFLNCQLQLPGCWGTSGHWVLWTSTCLGCERVTCLLPWILQEKGTVGLCSHRSTTIGIYILSILYWSDNFKKLMRWMSIFMFPHYFFDGRNLERLDMRSPLRNTPKLSWKPSFLKGQHCCWHCDSVGAPIMDHYALGFKLGLAWCSWGKHVIMT